MLASIQAGKPVELPEEETLASALAGGIGLDNTHSFALIRDVIQRHVTVTEEEIADAMRYAATHLHLVVEGGGAVALAAWLASDRPGQTLPEGPVVIVLSGGNVAPETLVRVLSDPS
jgi:threonine dehydratase